MVPGLVSTIVPVYNRPLMLREAVESVLAQTYRPIEIIVSDDGSTDDTPAVTRALEGAHPGIVRSVRGDRRGPGPAREAGRITARGEFIQYLDSDDLLRPRKFETQVRALADNPGCGAAYGYICLHRNGRPVDNRPYKWSGRALPTLFPWLLVDRWWNTDAPLFRRSVCDAVGPWTSLRWSQDWEYDGRVGGLRTKLVHTPEFVCDQRQHDGERQTTPADWAQPDRARARKTFLGLMFTHARAAGVTSDQPEMQHFSRWLFQTARLCGAAGLAEDARECFTWAKEAAGPQRAGQKDFRIYEALARRFGWTRVGRLALRVDALTRRPPSSSTLPPSWVEHAS